MAMSNCKECGKAVSTRAKTCPHCGVSKPAKKSKETNITSPIVGTAYLSPEPGKKEFVEVGQKIKKGQTIMIVEYKEVMNHVPSTQDGTVSEVLVKDGEPVEFGQPLISVSEGYVPPASQSSDSSSRSNSSQSENTFEKFSAGELDLATSFWGFLIVGTFFVGFVCGWLSGAYGKGWIIPLGLYTIFAVQGTWSSAEKYKIEQNKKKQTLVWGFLAQVICVLNAISVIGMFYESFIK